MSVRSSSAGLVLTTAATLAGFAANSLLCRAALAAGTIDPWSFTAIRLGAGAAALALLVAWLQPRAGGPRAVARAGSLASALALWGYAAAFSLAYVRLPAGVGALVLFGSVQATMLGWNAWTGARLHARQRHGIVLALAGLATLTLPGATLPDPGGLALMALAGVCWGAYTLRGRKSQAPLATTAGNFVRSAPFAVGALVAVAATSSLHVDARGAWLAATSGAIASGLVYALWYLTLPRLGAVRAAVVQLLVPVLTAVAGVVLLGEQITLRLLVAAPLVLGGIALVVLPRRSS